MHPKAVSTIRVALLFISIALCFSTVPARAGTTGGVGGRVVDATTSAPVTGARIEVVSPSASASTTTDAKGHYTFVSLLPDTYSVTVSRDGYQTFEQTGITIQADSQRNLDVALAPSVRELGKIVTKSQSGLVHPGQTIDLYSVTPSVARATQSLSGPGSIDQAYGTLTAIPGVYVPQGQQGWYQPLYIRGGDQDQIGYELDGVPVNRSYDNAPETMLTTIGQQELQVYTGGATASSDGQGISGYINQVIKTGSRTAFGSVGYELGSPTNYQNGSLEYGGGSPDGRFTYYVAGSIASQSYRFADQFNGVSLDHSGFFFPSFQFNPNPIDLPGITLGASSTKDQEAVINLHYAIPHHNDSGSDDIQALYINSNLTTLTYGSLSDFGGPLTFDNAFGYPDQFVYTGQVGAPINPAAVTPYLYPDSPDVARSFQSAVSTNLRASADNGFSLTKLQYQHNIGTHAYLRLLGFSTYSNWFIHDPIPVPATLQYILPDITFGGSVIYSDQLSDKNLLTLSGSIASSQEYRYSSGNDFLLGGGTTIHGTIGGNYLGSTPVGSYTDGTHCYDPTSGSYDSCYDSAAQASLDFNTGAIGPLTAAPPGSAAALHGAGWIATENAYGGLLNQVSPVLTAGSVEDRIHPNDRLTVDVGARVERYDDRLVNEATGYPARQFWFNEYNREFCASAGTFAPEQRPIDPVTGVVGPCPSGSSPVNLSLSNDATESNSVFEPRIGATYELTSDATLRASYGTYARPPNASWVQYGTVQQDLATPMAQKFLPYGFTTPQHDLLPDVSHNVDLSWEQHMRGTDMSFRVTPYYRGTMGQFENILLDENGNQSGVNVGSERSYGVELGLLKGNFTQDGITGLFTLTYNYSRFTYAKFASGFNVPDLINQQIAQYNAYTSACSTGGSAAGKAQFGTALCGATSTGVAAAACFTPTGAPDPSCASGDVPNPYWTKVPQSFLDPGGSYVPYDVIPDQPLQAGNGFGAPVIATLVAQYKHRQFTVTPSVVFSSGSYYGAPLSTIGADPASGNTIPIPDDYTGQFDNMGAFVQPSRLTGNLQLGYALTPRAQLSVTMTSLFDSCHQRGYAWDRAGFCTYTTLPFGQAPNSSTFTNAPGDPNYQFPYTVQNGNNNTQFLGTQIPFQMYVSMRFKV
jgi:hypothetical protein